MPIPPDDPRQILLRDALRALILSADPNWSGDVDSILEQQPELASRIEAALDKGRTLPESTLPPTVPATGEKPAPTLDYTVGAVAGGGDLPTANLAFELGDEPTRTHDPAEPGTPSPERGRPRVRYFGDYELIRELGRGGMGVVHLARQVSLDRLVALKMLISGAVASEPEIRRFQNEAEAVAQLDHPGIIPILEVGEHEGQRYFSMKLIKGPSLAALVHQFKNDPRKAARIIAEAADAVHHAHQRGILHRDIKPGNILIDEQGNPHVGDFGLARRLDSDSQLTRSDAVIGTPGYLSPEQASRRRSVTTTSTDVYGLGATLYALLTGHAPFRGETFNDTLHLVREAEPDPPSRENNGIDRNLEAICLKCLAKEPNRRYASAADLAADLRHWLNDEPIAARPVGPATRVVLWCRRRPVVAGLIGALAASILLGVAGITWNWLEVRRQRDLLDQANQKVTRERDIASAINGFVLDDLLAQASPTLNERQKKLTVEEALDRAAEAVGDRFKNAPAIEAAVRLTIGNTYLQLGAPAKASTQLEAGRAAAAASVGPEDPLTLELMVSLAVAERELGKPVEAEQRITPATSLLTRTLGPKHPKTLRAEAVRASILRDLNRTDEARSLFNQTLTLQQEALGSNNSDTVDTLHNLAALLDSLGEMDEAEKRYREVVNARTSTLRADHPLLLVARANLGAVLLRESKLNEASAELTTILPVCRRVLGDRHTTTLNVLANLGALELRSKHPAEAEAFLDEAYKAQAAELGKANPATLTTLSNLAMIPALRGRPADSEPLLRELLTQWERNPGPKHPDTIRAGVNLGLNLVALKKPDALSVLDRYIPAFRSLSVSKEDLSSALAVYGAGLIDQKRFDDAANVLNESLSIRRSILPPGAWLIKNAESLTGEALAGQGKAAEAEPLLISGAEGAEAAATVSPERRTAAFDRVIHFYESRKLPDQATAWRARKEKALAKPPTPSGGA
ncbi:MAG: serine/threonine-protein kinase [Isosphaeraceae bacterium]